MIRRSRGVALMILVPGLACFGTDEAMRSDQESGEITTSLAAAPTLQERIERADALYRQAEFDSALAIVEDALAEACARADSPSIARLLTIEAYVAYQRSDYDKAREIGQRALDVALAIGLSDELARAYNLQGLVNWQQSRFSAAIDMFTQTANVPGSGVDAQTLASINLGNVHTELGNLTEARASFQKGLELSRQQGNTRRESIALNNLGMLAIRVGDPLAAIPLLERAIALFREQGATNFEANALGQMGTAYTALGEVGRAIAVLDIALQLARSKGMRQEEASNLEALAEAYRAAGDHRRALALYADAETINRETGLVWETGSDQRSRSEIFEELGDISSAFQAAQAALATHRSVGARWEVFADLVVLADLSQQLGELDVSRLYLDEARALAAEFDVPTARVRLAVAEARSAKRSGKPHQVLLALGRVEADLAAGAYEWVWTAEILRAQAHAALGNLHLAVSAGRRAVDAVEHVRAGFGSAFLRSRFVAKRRDAYATLVQVYLEAGDTLAAFEASDHARGRALLEHLSLGDGSQKGGLLETVRLERTVLLRQIGEWSSAISYLESFPPDERDELSIQQLNHRIAEARAEYEALRVLAIERDEAAAALLGERSVSGREIQTMLRDEEILLQYLVTDDRLLSFVVTCDGARSFEHPIPADDLRRRVRIARDFISDPSTKPDLDARILESLFGILMAPAVDLLSASDRVVIIPDGALNYLPFAALVDHSTGRYLAEEYELRVYPSAAALLALRARHEATTSGSELDGAMAFAPLSRSLPATRREAEAFRKALSGSRTAVGGRATEVRLREALSGGGIVHVATHGVMNARNPMFSRLELARGSDEALDNDGRLEVHELFTISVRSPLVFLSGCETGLGPAGSTSFGIGQDYATLAQAFLYAGASNVISTLWRIEDEGAAEFAERFYEGLEQAGPLEALAWAQRRMISSERFRAPYYWASYQLAGDGWEIG